MSVAFLQIVLDAALFFIISPTDTTLYLTSDRLNATLI